MIRFAFLIGLIIQGTSSAQAEGIFKYTSSSTPLFSSNTLTGSDLISNYCISNEVRPAYYRSIDTGPSYKFSCNNSACLGLWTGEYTIAGRYPSTSTFRHSFPLRYVSGIYLKGQRVGSKNVSLRVWVYRKNGTWDIKTSGYLAANSKDIVVGVGEVISEIYIEGESDATAVGKLTRISISGSDGVYFWL